MKTHELVVTANPVRLGQSRAGWNISAGSPDPRAPLKPPKGVILPAPPSKFIRKPAKGESAFITNTVKHTVYLNEGTSDQAPPNYVESAMQQAVNEVGKSG